MCAPFPYGQRDSTSPPGWAGPSLRLSLETASCAAQEKVSLILLYLTLEQKLLHLILELASLSVRESVDLMREVGLFQESVNMPDKLASVFAYALRLV